MFNLINTGEKHPMSHILHFQSIDDLLGLHAKRFFGTGFRRITQSLSEGIILNQNGRGKIQALASIQYPEDWSKKDGAINLEPHLSSIDALVLSAQLCELYLSTIYILAGNEMRRLWLRRFTMRSGRNSYHQLDKFPAEATLLSTSKIKGGEAVYLSIFQTQIGSINLYMEYEHPISGVMLPKDNPASAEDTLGMPDKRYYGLAFKKPIQSIRDISIDSKNMRANAHIAIKSVLEDLVTEGQCAAYWPCLTPIDCMITIAQLAQALLYNLDGIERDASNNLWMREINMYCNRPVSSMEEFEASTQIVKVKTNKV